MDEAEHDIKIYPDRDQYYLLKSEKGRLSLLLENRPHTKNKENSNWNIKSAMFVFLSCVSMFVIFIRSQARKYFLSCLKLAEKQNQAGSWTIYSSILLQMHRVSIWVRLPTVSLRSTSLLVHTETGLIDYNGPRYIS